MVHQTYVMRPARRSLRAARRTAPSASPSHPPARDRARSARGTTTTAGPTTTCSRSRSPSRDWSASAAAASAPPFDEARSTAGGAAGAAGGGAYAGGGAFGALGRRSASRAGAPPADVSDREERLSRPPRVAAAAGRGRCGLLVLLPCGCSLACTSGRQCPRRQCPHPLSCPSSPTQSRRLRSRPGA